MNTFSTLVRSVAGTVLIGLLGLGLAGCGGASDKADGPPTLSMVTVNWIEGMAMTYMQEQILEDSLGMTVEVNEVQGGGIAFSSVASGDADVFNEAWLPTTHEGPWERNKADAQKLGYTYKGTSVGIAVPTYVEVDTFPDFADHVGPLEGTINGIESGAAINGQIQRTIERYGMGDQFRVQAASGPANWQALKTAINNEQPIAVAAWKPHWKWNAYDLTYVRGATTGDNVDIWGEPEDIFTIVDNAFIDEFPKEAVCFFKTFEADDRQVGSLMNAFRNRGDTSKREAARQWIQNHPEDVAQWMADTRACAASGEPVEPLPDDATYSSGK